MTEQSPVSVSDTDISRVNQPGLGALLRSELVVHDLEVGSRKRLFEELSHLISASDYGNELELDSEQVFDILHERERLGCTGVGKGIALPHGRMEGLETPIIAMIRLSEPIDYDAPDGEPVWLAVCLLVPAEANEIHLNLLADLAARFSDQDFIEQVYSAENSEALVSLFDGS